MDDRFAPVGAVFEESPAGGAEVGASVCVTVDGRVVVDLYSGYADAARTRPWERDTILNVYSCTKTVTALTALLLADRGEIDFAAPVSRYWPEFAANGKDAVTAAHVMSHSSGLSGWAEPITVASEDARVAEMIPPDTGGTLSFANPTELQANAAKPDLDPAVTATRAWRGAEIPAGNGTGNARSLATILAVLAGGGEAGGRRLLSEAGCRRALEVQVEGRDLILEMPLRFGLGFAVSGGMMPNPNTLYWGGLGGSVVIVDLDARTTFAYVPNRMAGSVADTRGLALAMAMWEAAGVI